MNTGLPDAVLFAIGGAILAVVVFLLVRRWEKRRREAFDDAARQGGWSPVPSPADVPDAVAGFHLFSQGRRRKVEAAFSHRSMNSESALLEYRFTTGSGKNSSTHRQTVLVVRREGLELPGFELRPESVLHRIGSRFGYQDIDLENRPEFSRAYLLRGEDEDAIRARFGDGGVVHHLEKHRGWSVEGRGEWMVIYRRRKRVKPEELREFLREADRLSEVLSGR